MYYRFLTALQVKRLNVFLLMFYYSIVWLIRLLVISTQYGIFLSKFPFSILECLMLKSNKSVQIERNLEKERWRIKNTRTIVKRGK